MTSFLQGMRGSRTSRNALIVAVASLAALLALWVIASNFGDALGDDAKSTAGAPLGPFRPSASRRPAPDLTFQDAAGTTHRLRDFRGRVVLLNLWATWCAPCRELAIYVDPTMDAQRKLAAIGVPTTLLIDPDGREVARKTGPETWDGPAVETVIRRYLPADPKMSER